MSIYRTLICISKAVTQNPVHLKNANTLTNTALSNTCGFDSLLSCLAAAFSYSEHFQTAVIDGINHTTVAGGAGCNNNSSLRGNELRLLIAEVGSGGSLKIVYEMREELLAVKFQPSKPGSDGDPVISCERSVAGVATKVLAEFPMITLKSRCTSEHCPNREICMSFPKITLKTDRLQTTTWTLHDLMAAADQHIAQPRACLRPFSPVGNRDEQATSNSADKQLCSGTRVECEHSLHELLVIEPVPPNCVLKALSPESNSYKGVTCDAQCPLRIGDLPLTLTVDNRQFNLRGVVVFQQSKEDPVSTGHYYAIVRRPSGHLYAMDDMMVKPYRVQDVKTTSFMIHLVVYTI